MKRGEELLATGSTVHAFIDKEGGIVRPPAWVVERFAEQMGRDGD